MNFRPVLEGDAPYLFKLRSHPEMARFLKGQPPKDFSAHVAFLASPPKMFFIIHEKERAVGYCQFDPRSSEVGWVIDPQFQDLGLGRKAVQSLIDFLGKTFHIQRAFLEVLERNPKAIHIYAQAGFTPISRREGVISMEKVFPPEISVVMSTYNRNRPGYGCESSLKRALNSILQQTFENFEVILINDASTDGTHEVCEAAAKEDLRIRYIHESVNSGALPAVRYNQGIRRSSGKFILSMFDDDELLPTAFADLYSAITGSQADSGLVYGSVLQFDVRKIV